MINYSKISIHCCIYCPKKENIYEVNTVYCQIEKLIDTFLSSEELTSLLYLGLITSKLLQSTRYNSCLNTVITNRISSTRGSCLYVVLSVNSQSHFGHTR